MVFSLFRLTGIMRDSISVLDEADGSQTNTPVNGLPSSATELAESAITTVTDAICVLLASGGPHTTASVYEHLKPQRETVTKKSIYSILHRLQKRGKVVREGKKWSARDPMPYFDLPSE